MRGIYFYGFGYLNALQNNCVTLSLLVSMKLRLVGHFKLCLKQPFLLKLRLLEPSH